MSSDDKKAINSSKTILINCWPGVIESKTFSPAALSLTLEINDDTILKLTSDSNKAILISLTESEIFFSVIFPWPLTILKILENHA